MIKNKINYSQRQYVIGSIFILVAIILLIKLFVIQIVDDSYKHSSNTNTLRYITQYPSRGKIYDRNGKLLVYNDAVYDLMIIPSQAKDIDTASFCKLLNISCLSEFVDAPMYETIDMNMSIVTVVNHLLRITCHNTLNRCKVEWVNHCRCQLHWDVRSVDITSVKE